MHRYNQSQVIDFDQEKLTAVYFCSYMYTCVLSSRYCNDQFYDRRLESFDSFFTIEKIPLNCLTSKDLQR